LLLELASARLEPLGHPVERVRQLLDLADALRPEASREVAPGEACRAFGDLAGRFDAKEGGFGGAPKFPHSADVSFLLRYHRRTGNPEALRMAVLSLEKMGRGGIRDHLGGGFHRYSVDARWLVPHFEKMLYDNALLARAYLEAAQAVARLDASSAIPAGGKAAGAFFREVARETLDWVLREMTSPEGGFYSSLDADSEGEEGKFYVWTPEQVESILGTQEAAIFCSVFDVTSKGNFEHGRSILHLDRPVAEAASGLGMQEADLRLRLAAARARLLETRERRVRPGRDEKVLADWNGLMISAMAWGARLFDEPHYLEAGTRAAGLILGRMSRDGRLLHSYKDGEARHSAHLTDYAHLLAGLLDLYEATFDPAWVERARALASVMLELFSDDRAEGLLFTARDHEPLIARTREGNDGAIPAGASAAALALPRLAALTGEDSLRKRAEETLRLYRDKLERFPAAFGTMICALDQHLDRQRQIVLACRKDDPALRPWLQALQGKYDPNAVLALADPADAGAASRIPLLEGKTPVNGKPAAYVCEAGACRAPVTSPEELPN